MFRLSVDAFYKETPKRIIALMDAHVEVNRSDEEDTAKSESRKVEEITDISAIFG